MTRQQEFTELLEPNLRALDRFVLGMVGDPSEAGDIVQETVTKAFIHFAEFRAESKFRTWLISIAINEVRARRRRESRSRISYCDFNQLEELATSSAEASPYHQYQQKEASQMLNEAMASLHPVYKEVIRLRAFDCCDSYDAARQLSISVPAMKARYYRAVHRLSDALARRRRKPIRPCLRAA